MWEKGKIVCLFRGVNKHTSYYQLEKETGRMHEALKRWHDIYKKYPDKEKYIKEEADPKAKLWAERVFEKEKKLLSEKLETPELLEDKRG